MLNCARLGQSWEHSGGRRPSAGQCRHGFPAERRRALTSSPPCDPVSLPGPPQILKDLLPSLVLGLPCLAGSLELKARENFIRADDCVFKTLWRRSLEGVSMAPKRKQEETGQAALRERGKGWAGRLAWEGQECHCRRGFEDHVTGTHEGIMSISTY